MARFGLPSRNFAAAPKSNYGQIKQYGMKLANLKSKLAGQLLELSEQDCDLNRSRSSQINERK